MGKLRDQMLLDLQLSGAKPSTQRTYLREAENLAKYFNKSPEQLGEDELKQRRRLQRGPLPLRERRRHDFRLASRPGNHRGNIADRILDECLQGDHGSHDQWTQLPLRRELPHRHDRCAQGRRGRARFDRKLY